MLAGIVVYTDSRHPPENLFPETLVVLLKQRVAMNEGLPKTLLRHEFLFTGVRRRAAIGIVVSERGAWWAIRKVVSSVQMLKSKNPP